MVLSNFLNDINSQSLSELNTYWLSNKIKKSFTLNDFTDSISWQTSSVIMLSWWIDSTTLLYLSNALWNNPIWLEFFYEWKPKQESNFVKKIVDFKWIDYFRIKYPDIYNSYWLQSDFNESNSFYYTIAAAFAYKQKIDYILAGQILDDWIDSDTTEANPEFYEKFNSMLKVEYWINSPQILAPFIYLNKKQVVDIWKFLNVPFEFTRSCIMDYDDPCWVCEQCIDRNRVLS